MRNSNPEISIIMPVYNSESFLEATINSVIHQPIKNIELICVDDGSTDSSGKMLDHFKKKDPRIKVYHIGDQGVGRARNVGLENASGKYIMFLDSDDYLSEQATEIALKIIEEEDADILIYAADIFPKNSERYAEVSERFLFERSTYLSNELTEKLIFSSSGINLYVWNKIYRHSMLIEHNIRFSEELEMLEDRAFMFDTIPYANKIVTISDMLYRYRLENAKSITGKVRNNYLYKTQRHIDLLKYIFTSWDKHPGITHKAHDGLIKWSLNYVYQNHYIKLSSQEQQDIRREFEKLIQKFYPECNDAFRSYFYI